MSVPGYTPSQKKANEMANPNAVHGHPGASITHLMCVDEKGQYWPRADVEGALEEVNRYYRAHGLPEFTQALYPIDPKAEGKNYYE